MKNIKIICCLILFSVMILSCEKNDVMPAYQKKGTATATVANIAVSNGEPAAGEVVTITMNFVNPSEDPLETVVLMSKVGDAGFTEVQTFNEQSGEKDKLITYEVTVVAPASETTVLFDMVITSQKAYPQIMRAAIEVQ